MRFVSTVALCSAALAVSLTAVSMQAQTASTAHRAYSSAAAHRSTSAKATAPEEGLAAVGSMPAVTGPVKTLYALRYVDLKIGTGEPAETRKFYTVHYTGWTTSGEKFDSSFDHDGKEPIVFPVGARQVIVGWDTGFEGMRVGGKRRLIVPYQLAYGERGRPPIAPKADLIFDVELLAQSDTPPQQQAPPAAPPAPKNPTQPQTQPQPGSNPATDPANKPAAKPE
ncbi:FKBP-type peptidyl-prolyl cis-trans isomerase [Terriglobus aquaticus]|uniref:Peptidyl-prolyl cis-trans isomerase n=1 Tax=Terriglobus aquaticus TaxID=940139 RepID=A0ABW9KL12_9BACT|nr:FKBP-type peptidyl-prolyl cis-trans isomerase [Terriglobus aquaticus]